MIETLPDYAFQAIVAGGVIVAAYLTNRLLVRRSLEKFAASVELEPHYANILVRFGSFITYLVAFFVILANLGVSGLLYGLLASAGFAGIVIGMAAREALADLLAGIILMAERPFKVGDPVQIGEVSGRLEAISFRSVTVRAWSGETVLMPNSKVSASVVRNFNVPNRRAEILMLVEHQADIGNVIGICRNLLMTSPDVVKDPEPAFIVGEFRDLGIELKVYFWVPTQRFFTVDTEIRKQILEEMAKEGIAVALPRMRVLDQRR